MLFEVACKTVFFSPHEFESVSSFKQAPSPDVTTCRTPLRRNPLDLLSSSSLDDNVRPRGGGRKKKKETDKGR